MAAEESLKGEGVLGCHEPEQDPEGGHLKTHTNARKKQNCI